MKKLQATLPTPLVATRNNPDIKLYKALGRAALLKTIASTSVIAEEQEPIETQEQAEALVLDNAYTN